MSLPQDTAAPLPDDATSALVTRVGGRFFCPHCGGDLRAHAASLSCASCGRTVAAIREGAIDFVAPDVNDRLDLAEFGYQWDNLVKGPMAESVVYNLSADQIRESLLDLLGVERSWFVGKRCLDVGCGHGQYSRVMASLGADVLAADLSQVVYRCAWERQREDYPGPAPVYVRANILQWPIRGPFDLVLSMGMAHHTPDPKLAVMEAAKCVGPGGVFLLYLYEKWQVGYVSVRELFPFPHYLPRGARLAWCRIAGVPLAFILAARRKSLPRTQDFRTATFGLHDAYMPRYVLTYRAEEPLAWMREAGLVDCRKISRCTFRGMRPASD